MIFFLTSQSLWLSALVVVGLGTLLSMLLARRYVDIKRLTANNEVAGFKFATIGVLYAVLLAFAPAPTGALAPARAVILIRAWPQLRSEQLSQRN